MRKSFWAAGVLGVLTLGCGWRATPVPVVGDLRDLAGEWEGTYSSTESGRSGTIYFRLDAASDSAFGDVWMEPTERQDAITRDAPSAPGARMRSSEALQIAFVRAEKGKVSGRLLPYQDPVTHEPLRTVFEGRLDVDHFHGTYRTRNEATGRVQRGEWTVRRNH